MEIHQVEYVVAVVEHGGFTKAAAAIPISQPSLSQGIRSLERELGTPLFHRHGREVSLTSAGEAFLGPARQLLLDAASAREAVGLVRGLEGGRLDLVSLPTLAVEPLVGLIGRFHAAHADVVVRVLDAAVADEAPELVRDGSCELGLVELLGGAAPTGLVAHRLADQELFAVSPPDSRRPASRGVLRTDRLADLALVTTPRGTSTRRLLDEALAAASVAPRIAVETEHRDALLPLVLAGAGTTILPAPLARQAGTQGAVVRRLSPPLRRTVGIVHRDRPLSPAAEAFLHLARPG